MMSEHVPSSAYRSIPGVRPAFLLCALLQLVVGRREVKRLYKALGEFSKYAEHAA